VGERKGTGYLNRPEKKAECSEWHTTEKAWNQALAAASGTEHTRDGVSGGPDLLISVGALGSERSLTIPDDGAVSRFRVLATLHLPLSCSRCFILSLPLLTYCVLSDSTVLYRLSYICMRAAARGSHLI
jgi:hypothetical protein